MTPPSTPTFVGAPDPESKTSPIVEEMNEDSDVVTLEAENTNVCYFNGVVYSRGDFVCTGSGELLRCEAGMWVQAGSCDPDNP